MNITNLKKQKNQLIKYSKHDLKKKKNTYICVIFDIISILLTII